MSGQVSRGSAGEYQADERAGVAGEGINYGLKRTEFSKEYNFMSPLRIIVLKTTLYLQIFKIYSASGYGKKWMCIKYSLIRKNLFL